MCPIPAITATTGSRFRRPAVSYATVSYTTGLFILSAAAFLCLAKIQPISQAMLFLFMFFDVCASELNQVGSVVQPDLLGIRLSRFDRPAVSEYAPDHPEGAYSDRRGAMNENRPVRRIVSDFEELGSLSVFGVVVANRAIEVLAHEL